MGKVGYEVNLEMSVCTKVNSDCGVLLSVKGAKCSNMSLNKRFSIILVSEKLFSSEITFFVYLH